MSWYRLIISDYETIKLRLDVVSELTDQEELFYNLQSGKNRGCAFNHQSTRTKGIEQACYPVTQTIQNNTVLEPWILFFFCI